MGPLNQPFHWVLTKLILGLDNLLGRFHSSLDRKLKNLPPLVTSGQTQSLYHHHTHPSTALLSPTTLRAYPLVTTTPLPGPKQPSTSFSYIQTLHIPPLPPPSTQGMDVLLLIALLIFLGFIFWTFSQLCYAIIECVTEARRTGGESPPPPPPSQPHRGRRTSPPTTTNKDMTSEHACEDVLALVKGYNKRLSRMETCIEDLEGLIRGARVRQPLAGVANRGRKRRSLSF